MAGESVLPVVSPTNNLVDSIINQQKKLKERSLASSKNINNDSGPLSSTNRLIREGSQIQFPDSSMRSKPPAHLPIKLMKDDSVPIFSLGTNNDV